MVNEAEEWPEGLYYVWPLIINFGEDQWINPEMAEDFLPDTDNPNPGDWMTDSVLIARLMNERNEHLYVVFWSDFLYDEDNLDKWHNKVVDILEVTLIEDTFAPGGEQFCFTPFGEKVGEFFRDTVITYSVSPDVGIQRSFSWWST